MLFAYAKSRRTLRRILRMLVNLPYPKLCVIPGKWRSVGGTLTQHHVARAVLDGSGLPVTYLNMPAYLMDDLIRWSGPIRERSLFLIDRQSVVSGKSVSVRVDLGGRRIIKKQIKQHLPTSTPHRTKKQT